MNKGLTQDHKHIQFQEKQKDREEHGNVFVEAELCICKLEVGWFSLQDTELLISSVRECGQNRKSIWNECFKNVAHGHYS